LFEFQVKTARFYAFLMRKALLLARNRDHKLNPWGLEQGVQKISRLFDRLVYQYGST